MAGTANDIIVLAQAGQADTLQSGEIVAPADAHAQAGHGTEAHTEAHSSFPPFDSAYFGGQLLWLAITFAALYFIMSRMALPRIGSILETRRARIDGDLKEAERLRQETEKAAAAYEAALAEARKNAHAIAEETRNSIRQDIDNRRADVEAGLAKRMSEAEARIEATKQAALANVGEIAADTAKALVERIAGSVSPQEAAEAVASVSRE